MKMNNKAKKPMKSRQILFIFDARDCNPNSERETGMEGPRIDPLTNKAILSDVCLKRTIRDYFLNKGEDFDKILVRQRFEYSDKGRISMKQTLLNDIGHSESDLRRMDENELYNIIKSNFIDHRLFGSIFYLNRKLRTTTGPVQFENTLSFNRPNLIEMVITSTIASESEKGAGAIGRSYYLDYAIFPVHGIIKESLSKKSGASELDAVKLFDALWNGIKSRITRTKIQQIPRFLISLVMKDSRFQISDFKKSIYLTNEDVLVFEECKFEISKLLNILQQFHNQIELVEFREDPFIKYKYKGNLFNNLSKIESLLTNCPPLIELTDYY